MNIAAAGKLALCICTGAVVGAGVNEARHNADKPKVVKTASKAPAGRKVVQFPCEPYIVQDQMMRDAQIPSDFEATNLPEYAELITPGGGGSGGGGGDDGNNPNPPPPTQVPEPAALVLFGLGAAGLFAGRKFLLRRKI